MEITHEIDNVKELERALGFDSIEMFIESFSVDLELIDDMMHMKPWEKLDIPEIERIRFEMAQIPANELRKGKQALDEEKKVLLG